MSGANKTLPGYIYSPDREKQAKAVETWVAREARKIKAVNRMLIAYSVVMTTLVGLLGIALVYAVPLIRILPVFFHVKPDGVMETAITTESLPSKLADVSIQAWLWQYVLHRESYSWVAQDYNNKVVQAMSSEPVRELYQQFSSGKNPDSYMAKLGRKGVIAVRLAETKDYHPSIGGRPGSITFHYVRAVYVEGEPRQKETTWTTTLEFIQDYKSGFNIMDILQFNPARIVITSYPGALPLTPEGPAQ